MSRFRYQATDAAGNRHCGELEAAGPEQVEAHLGSQGLRLESLGLAEPDGQREAGGRLSAAEVTDFTRQVAGLNQSRLPLHSGLRALSAELASRRLSGVLSGIADQLEAGCSLEDAVAQRGHSFPPHLQGLVLAGVQSGKLGEVLEQFTRYHSIGLELKRKLWVSLAYPACLVAMLALLFLFIGTVIIKEFAKIFNDFGLRLPALIKGVILVSRVAADVGTWLLLGSLIALMFLLVWKVARGGLQSLSCRIPLIGPLRRWTALVEFCHLLGLLVESEVPLPTALQLTGEGMREASIARVCAQLRRSVAGGLSLSDSVELVPQFPGGLARILRWAEGHQSLPGALHMAGDIYEARARAQATFVGIVCTVLAVILVIFGIALVLVSLFLPLVQLMTNLSM